MQVSEMNYTQPYEITKRTIHTYDIKNYYYIHPQKIKHNRQDIFFKITF